MFKTFLTARNSSGVWDEASRNGQEAEVYSGHVIQHTVEHTDGTWQVDSGKRCSYPKGMGRSLE
jgi:hypothetical protein